MDKDKDDVAKTLGIGAHRRRSWTVAMVVLVLCVAAGAWVFLLARTGDGDTVFVTEPVTRGDIEVTVTATGTVEPTDLLEISSELSGTVQAVFVDFNDPVEEGTVLARLDTSRLEAQLAVQKASLAVAEAQLATARATLEEARQTYDRGLELARRGVESEQELIAQRAVYERAKAQFQAAEASRDLAQAQVDLIQVDIDKACICSSVKGVVLDRDVDAGQIVAASLSAPILFTVAEDLSRMELQVDIDEADVGRVAVGQPATFSVEAYDERIFPAELSELRYASETVEGVVTYKGILTLDNSDMALRPGMTATAEILVASVRDALLVPNVALRYAPPPQVESAGNRSGGLVGIVFPRMPSDDRAAARRDTVWVLRDGAPVEIEVQTGETDGYMTAILGGALEEGDRVITDRIDAE